jgi:protein subunit release factor B
MAKELVFSVTAADCEWSYTRGTGNGGQKKNKTNSAVHCIHKPSGAHGYAEDNREQPKNRVLAFKRMAASEEFQAWNKVEFLRRTGKQAVMEENVKRQMRQIRVDVKNEEGRWTAVDKDDPLPDDPK